MPLARPLVAEKGRALSAPATQPASMDGRTPARAAKRTTRAAKRTTRFGNLMRGLARLIW